MLAAIHKLSSRGSGVPARAYANMIPLALVHMKTLKSLKLSLLINRSATQLLLPIMNRGLADWAYSVHTRKSQILAQSACEFPKIQLIQCLIPYSAAQNGYTLETVDARGYRSRLLQSAVRLGFAQTGRKTPIR